MPRHIVVAALFAIASAAVSGCADGTQDPVDIESSKEPTEPETTADSVWSTDIERSFEGPTYGLRASKAGTVYYPFSTSTSAAAPLPAGAN